MRTSVSVARLLAVLAIAAVCRAPALRQRGVQDPEDSGDSPAVRALLDAAARSEPDGYDDCSGGGLQSFAIIVTDSVTGEPMARGARLIWRAGRKVDTTYALPNRTGAEPIILQGPFGRPGTYDVVIRQLGYRDWSYSGIRVEQGPEHCSIPQDPFHQRLPLRARLQRLPGRG